MNKYLSIVEFSNSYCFVLCIDFKKYPFSFREFNKKSALEKGKLLSTSLGIPLCDNIGLEIEENQW